MFVKELTNQEEFALVNGGERLEDGIRSVYCCDLLSLVMGRAPSGCAWVTVMGNVNSIAVAVLADISCVVLAEGAVFDDIALKRAKEKGVVLFRTEDTVFNAARRIHKLLGDND